MLDKVSWLLLITTVISSLKDKNPSSRCFSSLNLFSVSQYLLVLYSPWAKGIWLPYKIITVLLNEKVTPNKNKKGFH